MSRINSNTTFIKSQPPCEAVSWNILSPIAEKVRSKSASLWGCELKSLSYLMTGKEDRSASLWGCELKSYPSVFPLFQLRQPPCEAVSWNDLIIYGTFRLCVSASLWGCELKCVVQQQSESCDAVSLLVRLWVEISCPQSLRRCALRSASLWGCELKYVKNN